MKLFLIVLVVVSASALPFSSMKNGDIPLQRQKRQNQETKFNIQKPGIATITHTGTLVNNDIHRLDGSAYAGKDLSKSGIRPEAYGGRVDYSHLPSGSSVGISADHMHRAGTDVKATGTWNFIHNKNADVGISGQYDRHFGQFGNRHDYKVMLGGKVRF